MPSFHGVGEMTYRVEADGRTFTMGGREVDPQTYEPLADDEIRPAPPPLPPAPSPPSYRTAPSPAPPVRTSSFFGREPKKKPGRPKKVRG